MTGGIPSVWRPKSSLSNGIVTTIEFSRKSNASFPYTSIIFGPDYEVIPALVLTGTSDLYRWVQLPGSSAELPVCSGDMLFNLFDEFIEFLNQD